MEDEDFDYIDINDDDIMSPLNYAGSVMSRCIWPDTDASTSDEF